MALVGCGRIGTQTSSTLRDRLPRGWVPLSHAEAIAMHEGIELKAFCDIDLERAAQAAKMYNVAKYYEDYRMMIDKEQPALMAVATRTAGRTDIVSYAAKAGVKGLHVEKPIALNLADCDDALGNLSENGVHLTYGTTRRYMDVYRQAKAMIEAGDIGTLEHIAIEHGHTLLLWNHPHSVDLMLYFAGTTEISAVQAHCNIQAISNDRMKVDDDPLVENALVQFKNGIIGVITGARGMNTRISGSRGQLTIMADGSGIEIRYNKSGNGPYFLDSTYLTSLSAVSGTQRAIAELVESTTDRVFPTISYAEVRTGLNILLAIAYSAVENGRKVILEDIPPQFTVTGRFGDMYA